MSKKKIVIIGAGIIGACIARELSKYENFKIFLLEKEVDVCLGISKANTAILHAGFDDDKDKFPLRATLCSKGNYLWHDLVKKLHIPVLWSGSLVVATNDEQMNTLHELLKRGIKNKVPGLEVINRTKLLEIEPNIIKSAGGALYAKTAGVISPYEAVFALIENSIDNGTKLILNTKVKDFKFKKTKEVITNSGSYKFDYVINASGLYGDEISKLAGINDFTINPRKGEYYLFDKSFGRSTNHIVFPTPTKKSKGIVVSFTVENHTLIGPNAQDVSSKEDYSTTHIGLDEVYGNAKQLVWKIPPKEQCIRNFAGLRPESSTGDFIVKNYPEVEGFINVVGIRSPGLTAAPAIGEMVRLIIEKDMDEKLYRKDNFNPIRKPIIRFEEQSIQKQDVLIQRNPKYGKIICRCETVSEAEIIEAIKRGATTVDGVKFRTRAGMGRCQGGFCSFRVMEILSRELNLSKTTIDKKGKASQMVICTTKDLFGDEK